MYVTTPGPTRLAMVVRAAEQFTPAVVFTPRVSDGPNRVDGARSIAPPAELPPVPELGAVASKELSFIGLSSNCHPDPNAMLSLSSSLVQALYLLHTGQ